MRKINVDFGDCPKCGYFLIKHHPVARCAKKTCGFEMSWNKYRELFVIPEPKLTNLDRHL